MPSFIQYRLPAQPRSAYRDNLARTGGELFRPYGSAGRHHRKALHLPGGQGIRVDTGIYSGYQIPPYYDSMLAKLIVHGNNREEAIAKMKSALGEVIIQGVDTNVDYQFEIMNDPDYQKGIFDIGFLESHQIGGVKVNEA